MTGEAFDAAITDLARRQHGLIARRQAVAFGATPGILRVRLRSGRWEPVWPPNVYRIAGAPRTWLQDVLAACLAWGSDAAASHRAAAALRRLAGFPFGGAVELTVPRRVRRRVTGVVVHVSALDEQDRTVVFGIPATGAARTLIDLAGTCPKDAVEEALDDALRRGLVSRRRLLRRLDELGGKGRPGVAVLRRLCAARGPAETPQSVLETRLLRALRRAGLPEPVPQHPVREPGGRVAGVVDFAYPAERVAVEADGRRWHSGRRDFDHDRRRGNRLALAGWLVVRVTWTQLHEGEDEVVASVRAALAARRGTAERVSSRWNGVP